jgi:subtilisin family serine protease
MPPPGVSNGGTWAHGTHGAGLLSANTDNNTGIASASFNCSIMCVKVSTGEQDYPYITHGYNGILYASQAGHDAGDYAIINNSWGGLGYSVYEQAAINIAHDDYGAIVLAAGGNGGGSWDLNTNEFAHYPSSYDNVIAVCPSGTGDSWNNWATYHASIDLASPGENIRSTRIGNGYTNWSGSSMATPIAASVMGLLKSYHPNWTNEQIERMVVETSDPNIYTVNPSFFQFVHWSNLDDKILTIP